MNKTRKSLNIPPDMNAFQIRKKYYIKKNYNEDEDFNLDEILHRN